VSSCGWVVMVCVSSRGLVVVGLVYVRPNHNPTTTHLPAYRVRARDARIRVMRGLLLAKPPEFGHFKHE